LRRSFCPVYFFGSVEDKSSIQLEAVPIGQAEADDKRHLHAYQRLAGELACLGHRAGLRRDLSDSGSLANMKARAWRNEAWIPIGNRSSLLSL
jgi:hypothetical protein